MCIRDSRGTGLLCWSRSLRLLSMPVWPPPPLLLPEAPGLSCCRRRTKGIWLRLSLPSWRPSQRKGLGTCLKSFRIVFSVSCILPSRRRLPGLFPGPEPLFQDVYKRQVEKASAVKDKLIEMTHLNETLYGCGIACSSEGCPTKCGSYMIDLLLANVCKQNAVSYTHL